MDESGIVYVADEENHRIRTLDLNDDTIKTLAGKAAAGWADGDLLTQAKFNEPEGLALDPAGLLFIADRGNQRIRRIIAGRCSPVVDESPCLSNTGDHGRGNDDIIIKGYERWLNTERFIPGLLKIYEGGRLEIVNSAIKMMDCAKIVVKGSLDIIDSDVEGCEHKRWKGIEVHGNDKKDQLEQFQGKLTVHNSEIRDAEIGILLGKRNGNSYDKNKSGGILEIGGGSRMVNNRVHIMATDYSRKNNNVIKETVFDYLNEKGAGGCAIKTSPAQLRYEGIDRPKIRDNVFKNAETGIEIMGSKNFEITNNQFINIDKPIKTENSYLSDEGAKIEENTFTNAKTAIAFKDDDHSNLDVTCNTFNFYTEFAIKSENTVLKDQGSQQTGAGNMFYSNSTLPYNCLDHNGPPLNYFYDPKDATGFADPNIMSPTITKVQANADRGCMTTPAKTSYAGTNNKDNTSVRDHIQIEHENVLLHNFPNPFKNTTTIIYSLDAAETQGEIRVYNIFGKLLGSHLVTGIDSKLELDCNDYAQGVYFYSLVVNDAMVDTKRMAIIR